MGRRLNQCRCGKALGKNLTTFDLYKSLMLHILKDKVNHPDNWIEERYNSEAIKDKARSPKNPTD
jgi:hypothetical protein